MVNRESAGNLFPEGSTEIPPSEYEEEELELTFCQFCDHARECVYPEEDCIYLQQSGLTGGEIPEQEPETST